MCDGSPDDRQADAKVFMRHDIAHAAHLQPGQFGILLLDLQRNVPSRFPDDFQIADNRVYNSIINAELLVIQTARL